MNKKSLKHVKKASALSVLAFLAPFIITIFFLFLFLVILLGIFNEDGGFDSTGYDFSDGNSILNDEVLGYRPLITEYAEKHGVPDQVDLIMALMMQESGGKGNDPMQSSESHCGSVGCIDDPELSIDKGIEYFASVWEQADEKMELALQSYNFGSGFIDYVEENEGDYTLQQAIDFSAEKYEELKHTGDYGCVRPDAIMHDACYGDIYYVDAVLQYYHEDGEFDGTFTMPLDSIYITSSFGERTINGKPDFHNGTDLRCKGGITEIKAMMDGEARVAPLHSSLGYYVSLLHNEEVITRYAHMSEQLVRNGDKVKKGDVIGICGSTGNSTGPHLHLDVIIDGENLDPQTYFGF